MYADAHGYIHPFNKLYCRTEDETYIHIVLFIYIVYSWMFNVINSSKMNNLKTIQEFSRTPENIQGQHDVFQESRT